MAQVMMLRRGGQQAGGIPRYTYTGISQVIDDGGENWQIKFLTDGTLTIQSYGDFPVDVFLVGGGGAGNHQGGAGGGGYSNTLTNMVLLRNVGYPITIGAGGSASGWAGSPTTAFGNIGNGGGGGIAGGITGRVCTVQGTTGLAGNVYYYSSLGASAVSIGNNYRTVSLAYPFIWANHNNGTTVLKAAGAGYYRCSIVSEGDFIASNGSNGTGGSAAYAFSSPSTVLYGGEGSAPGTASGDANTGKGGDGSNNYNGTAFGAGGSGIVIIRNLRVF